jgi:hypothetical protein
MRASLLVLLVSSAVLGGCQDPKKDAPPVAPTGPIEGLSIDDVAVETGAYLAIGTEGEQAWRVTLATADLSCEQLTKAYPERPEGLAGKRIDFWLMQPLLTDGQLGPWTFRSAYVMDPDGERGLTTRGAQLDDVVPTPDGITVKGLELACQDQRAMVMWHGDVQAKSCGRVARKEEGQAQEGLSLKIAGRSFAIRGATVRPQGKNFHLRLSRAPHSCNSIFTEGFDFYLDVVFSGGDEEGEQPTLKFASLLGDIFPGDPAGSKGKEAFVLQTAEPVVGEGDVEMTLKGTLDVGGYPTSFDGKVKARRCTPM